MDRELIAACRKSREINLNGSGLTIPALELFVSIVQTEGECTITNCSSTPTLMEIGAYLAEVARETADSRKPGDLPT